ncbi:MAG: phospho-sugar mutase [Oscillospiraceae bacterium]|nr:phospho-sugar mutase [Oscillospiraceae bacterium]
MNKTQKSETFLEKYNYWLENATSDIDLVRELKGIERRLTDAKAAGDHDTVKLIGSDLEDRFYQELEFGTGGLRGILGAGTNRMNHYTVARATQGLADFAKALNPKNTSIAISYDSRHKSAYFAKISAQVLAQNGIKCRLFGELMPTPVLSYAVRYFGCDAGIMITASHNPGEYNGYKAYGSDGCQLSLEDSEAVIQRIKKLDMFTDVKLADFDAAYDKGEIVYIDKDFLDDYFAEVKEQSIHKNVCRELETSLKVVYTPLNGAGNKPVRRILKEMGVTDVTVVPEQEKPDGDFPTCSYPNPEFREALELGLKLCDEVQPDLLLATDPDADRVGIAVKDEKGKYCLFTGNEVGAMLMEYICRERTAKGTMPQVEKKLGKDTRPVAVKSIVSTAICDKIAAKYNVTMIDTLTGFKFIAGIAGELEKKDELERFIYGFEESYGYLAGSYVRDKDAVSACMLICEMAAFYKKNGSSLIEARTKMYDEYGYYYHYTDNLAFKGSEGMRKMNSIMSSLRRSFPKSLCGLDVVKYTDYDQKVINNLAKGKIKTTGLPKSNVIKLELADGSSIIVRPSGTEPKLKVYYTCVGNSMENSVGLQKKLMEEFALYVK